MLCHLMNRPVLCRMDSFPCTHSVRHEDQKPYTDRDIGMSPPGKDPNLKETKIKILFSSRGHGNAEQM